MSRRNFSSVERLLGVKCWICAVRVRRRDRVHNHHIDGNRKNNRRENQAWVCLKCHDKVSKSQNHGRPVNVLLEKGVAVRAYVGVQSGALREQTEMTARNEVLRLWWGPFLTTMLLDGVRDVELIGANFRPYVERMSGLPYGSERTAKRYLDEELASGVLKPVNSVGGTVCVDFRDKDIRRVWMQKFLPTFHETVADEPIVESVPRSVGEALKQESV